MGAGSRGQDREGDPGRGGGTPLVFRLLYREKDIWLSRGQMLLGRSADCALVLNDPSVSRAHARLTILEDAVTIEDVGSANGVLVNGERIQGVHRLRGDDEIVIGQQQLRLVTAPASSQVVRRVETAAKAPVVARADDDDDDDDISDGPTARREMLELIGSMAEKALAMRRPDEAERLLSSHLGAVLRALEARQVVPATRIEVAARYALKLAGGTGKASWADFVIRLYAACAAPLPAPIGDELYKLVRKLPALDLRLLREYLGALRAAAPRLKPTERFLVQRVEGLERLAALK